MKIRHLALALLAPLVVAAQAHFPSAGCWKCGFGGGAEALYWRPNVCNTFVAILSEEEAETIIGIKPDYDWGVRGHLGLSYNCFIAYGSYLWLETDDRFQFSPPVESALYAPGLTTDVTRLVPRLRFRYQAADLRLGQILRNKRGCRFAGYANGRWLEVTRLQETAAATTTELFRLRQLSTFEGGSLGIGLMADFCVWDGLYAFGDLGASACVGRQRFRGFTSATATPSRDGQLSASTTALLPSLNFRLGVNYGWDCLCTTIFFEAGYELQHFWNLLIYTPTDTDPIVVGMQTLVEGGRRTCIDVGFGGPFAGIRAIF